MAHGDYIVADAANTFIFTASDPLAHVLSGVAVFSVSPTSAEELVNLPTKGRPDLLVGRVFGNTLRFQALDVGLEPLCSTVVHRVVTALGLDGCQRTRADGFLDTINTPAALILGAPPKYVYHGTSSTNLPQIEEDGLCIDLPANWEHGGRGHVYLAAEGQVAAFHARRTAERLDGDPIVLKCPLPDGWLADHDVQSMMVHNPAVPSNDELFLAQEAGLFAVPAMIPWGDIVEVRTPQYHSRFDTWPLA